MRMTAAEVEQEGINIKAWLGEMQKAGRAPGAPTFALKGPCTLDVRRRTFSASAGVASAKSRKAFMGGETFRVSGVVCDRTAHDDTLLIAVTLTPASMELAKEISGMTLPLLKCFELLADFEAWTESFGQVKYREPAKKPPTLTEQRQANEMWGAW